MSEVNVNLFESQEVTNHEVETAEAFYGLAMAKYYTDSLESSYANFQWAIKLKYYDTANCFLWQGHIFLRYAKPEKACALFQKAKELGDQEAQKLLNIYCQHKTIK
jgi:tetratricopeptide (TPR) repeat protein